MNRCEHMELSISALLDGEADLHEQGEVVDHLLACPDCREFWRQARDFQGRLDAELPVEGLPAPGARRPRLRLLPAAGGARRWLQVAAVVAPLAVGLGVGHWMAGRGAGAADPGLPPRGSAIELQLASDRGALDDRDFVEMVLRLLRADRRYHQQMLEILRHVEPALGEGAPASGEFNPAVERGEGGETPVPESERRVVY